MTHVIVLIGSVEHAVQVPEFDSYPADDTDADDFYDAIIQATRAAGLDSDDIDDWYAPRLADRESFRRLA